MANPRPQLSLVELQQLKWLLGGALALLSACTVFFMEVEAWGALAAMLLAIPLFTLKPSLARRVPGWAHRLAFPTIVALAAWDFFSSRELLPSMIRLDLLLLLYRATTPRRRRDDLQLVLLGLFLIVIAGVLTVSLAFAVQIMLFTAVALALLLLVTLAGAAGAGVGEPVGWTQVRWRVLLRRVRAVVDWRVIGFGAVLFVGVVALSIVLFLAIPRFELNSGIFFDRMMTRKSLTGFSENVQFGDVVDIQQDTSVALSVDVSDRQQVPATPYWRMLVLDEYSGGGFRMSPVLQREFMLMREPRRQIEGRAPLTRDSATWTFYFEAGVSRYLPLLGDFRQLTFTEPQSLRRSSILGLVARETEPSKMFAYEVNGMEISNRVLDPGLTRKLALTTSERESGYLTLQGLGSEERAKLVAWVGEIGAPGDDVTLFAERANDWLGQRHRYSLQSKLPAGRGDPLVRWLDSTGPGHCELFAGSLVLLARAAGYPARMVTGFKGGAWNVTSESLTIRQSDAHAWCELFDGKGAWWRADPTPGSVIGATEQANLVGGEAALERMRDLHWMARLDGLRVFWYRRIVNFDQDSQVELAKRVKDSAEGLSRRLREAIDRRMERLEAWLKHPWDWRRAVRGGIVVLGAGLAIWTWRRFGRSVWWRWRRRRGGLDPVRRDAGVWLVKLQKRGQPGSYASEWAGLERLRYGPRASWPEPQATFRAVRQALRRRVP